MKYLLYIFLVFLLFRSTRTESTYHNSFILKDDTTQMPIKKDNKEITIKNLVVFGDSLSDNQNTARKTLNIIPSSDFYWRGRFSNGPMWVDYLSSAAEWKLLNYASGGSRVSYNDFGRPSGITQLENFLNENRHLSRSQTMIAIWFGGNDYLTAFKSHREIKNETDLAEADKMISYVHTSLEKMIKRLKANGFKNIMLLTLPRLNIKPLQLTQDNLKLTRDYVVFYHNKKLKELAEKENIFWINTYKINEDTSSSPEKYNFSSLERCYQGNLTGINTSQKVCYRPYLSKFYDDLHPNSKMHCYYAAKMILDLGLAKEENIVDKCKVM